ncbi:hypothetical protein L202_08101 [Cryptococcus amylolentus CBS 6039]|uniref:Uncharacterized protein n=1 Tax=Cryptococcus amylolentus CBS 6039 TaxID=1295533 RepID=A0A1E3HB78_9TREE|nr:hypothetical protein L202_08101 [Cryptococcus amylolentus CBS 6039]ODN73598.1 hypothetical protein L202_08101 [Cryptococcus amylolentus CBS 6039]
MSSATTTALPLLPPEIQAAIFDLLLDLGDKHTLATIARTSQYHLSLVLPRLYESIELSATNAALLFGDTGDVGRMAQGLDEMRRKQSLLSLVHRVTFLDLAALDLCMTVQPAYELARIISVTPYHPRPPRPEEAPLSRYLFPNITLENPSSTLIFSQPFLSALQRHPGPYLVRGTPTHPLFHLAPSSGGHPHLTFHLPPQPKPILNAFICDMLCAYKSRATTIVGVERDMSWDLGHSEVGVFELGMKDVVGKSEEEKEDDTVHSICEHIHLHPRLQGVLLLPSPSTPLSLSPEHEHEHDSCARIEEAVKKQAAVGGRFFVRPSREGGIIGASVSGRRSPLIPSASSSTKDSDTEDVIR